MNYVPFHLTRMGRDFYEGAMPALVHELARLNENLERVLPAVASRVEEASQVEAESPNTPNVPRPE